MVLLARSRIEVRVVDVYVKWGVDTKHEVQLFALGVVSKETMVFSQVGVVATEWIFLEVVRCELFSVGTVEDVGKVFEISGYKVLALWALVVVVA